MPDISKDFQSKFIKANIDVKQDDHIRFEDAGERQADKRNLGQYNWFFAVSVIRNGNVVVTGKKFQLNSGNFKATAKMYGSNSDNWNGKEMVVNIVKRQNPQTGGVVDGIALSSPGARGEVEGQEEPEDFTE